MGESRASIDINAPARRVWEYLTDPQLQVQWIPGLKQTILEGDGDVGPGSCFTSVWESDGRRWQSQGEFLRYEIGRLYETRSIMWNIVATGTITLEERDGTTTVEMVARSDYLKGGSLWRRIDALLGVAKGGSGTSQGISIVLSRLKQIAEDPETPLEPVLFPGARHTFAIGNLVSFGFFALLGTFVAGGMWLGREEADTIKTSLGVFALMCGVLSLGCYWGLRKSLAKAGQSGNKSDLVEPPIDPTSRKQPIVRKGIRTAAIATISAVVVITVALWMFNSRANPESLESGLIRAAAAQELYGLTHNGHYTASLQDLNDLGLMVPDGVSLRIVTATMLRGSGYYCMEGSLDRGNILMYDSNVGEPQKGHCPGD